MQFDKKILQFAKYQNSDDSKTRIKSNCCGAAFDNGDYRAES